MACEILEPELDQEMALSKSDKEWLSENFEPRRTSNVIAFVAKFGAPAAFVSMFIAMAALTLGAIYQAVSHVKEETTFRTNTDNHLRQIDASLASLRVALTALNPASVKSQTDALNAIASAKKNKTPLLASDVKQAGRSFLEASKTYTTAWPLALEFASYRSSLLSDPSVGQTLRDAKAATSDAVAHTELSIIHDEDKKLPLVSWFGGRVPQDRAARFEPLNHPMSQPSTYGVAYLLCDGGSVILSEAKLAHVVLRNVEVHYSGGPVYLEDVTFINCKFVFDNEETSRLLVAKILDTDKVSFSA